VESWIAAYRSLLTPVLQLGHGFSPWKDKHDAASSSGMVLQSSINLNLNLNLFRFSSLLIGKCFATVVRRHVQRRFGFEMKPETLKTKIGIHKSTFNVW